MLKTAALIVSAITLATLTVFTQQAPVHAPDGGTRQMITSIAVPPLPHAPFSATVNTEWTRYLDDGAVSVWRNHRLIARDGSGRIFQERRAFATDGDRQQTRLTETDISDPASHTTAVCDPSGRSCQLHVFQMAAVPQIQSAGETSSGSLTRQPLGTTNDQGLEIIGTRETQTLKGAAVGADRPISIVKEFWYSPKLGLNVSTKRTDPRAGIEIFTVTDINMSEPDPNLFSVPQGATLIDLRRR